VLPGPSRAELARTALARAAAAAVTVTAAGPDRCAFAAVPVRVNAAGQPVLLPAAGSALAGLLAGLLAAGPADVTVAVPADSPFTSLRPVGTTVRGQPAAAGCGTTPYVVTLRSVEFAGSGRVPVDLGATGRPRPARSGARPRGSCTTSSSATRPNSSPVSAPTACPPPSAWSPAGPTASASHCWCSPPTASPPAAGQPDWRHR
jgi:hypothetical protein